MCIHEYKIEQTELFELKNEIKYLKTQIEVNNDFYIQNLTLMVDRIAILEERNKHLLYRLKYLKKKVRNLQIGKYKLFNTIF